MPTPLTDAIEALTTYANSVTGASDTTLSEAVATLANGYGGGGGGGGMFEHLATLTVEEDTRTFNIDLTPYDSYGTLLVFENVTLNRADWLYYVQNGSSASGGTYNNGSVINHVGLIYGVLPSSPAERPIVIHVSPNYFNIDSANTQRYTNYFVYGYNSGTVIKAGSTYEIYGEV